MSSDQTAPTATSNAETSDLKAGHAPAIKVGGMRVAAGRPRHSSQGEDKDKANAATTDADQEGSTTETNEGQNSATEQATTENEDTTGAVANHTAGEMVSGAFVPIQKAFPPEATKHIHDKPGTHPKHEYHSHGRPENQVFLNQPRKQ